MLTERERERERESKREREIWRGIYDHVHKEMCA